MESNVTLNEARETINHLVQGVDPYTGEILEDAQFLQNPRLIRCFALMSELLTRVIEKPSKQHQTRLPKFTITEEEAKAIRFRRGDIGVQALLEGINAFVDVKEMEPLNIGRFYSVLTMKGILEKSKGQGITKTITNKRSQEVGITTVRSSFEGQEYDRIMYSEDAKKFIKAHIYQWFSK